MQRLRLIDKCLYKTLARIKHFLVHILIVKYSSHIVGCKQDIDLRDQGHPEGILTRCLNQPLAWRGVTGKSRMSDLNLSGVEWLKSWTITIDN